MAKKQPTKKETPVKKAPVKEAPVKRLTKIAPSVPGAKTNIIIDHWSTTIPPKQGGIDASYELFNRFFKEIKTPVRFRFTTLYIIGYGGEADLVQLGKDLVASKEINQYQEIDFRIV